MPHHFNGVIKESKSLIKEYGTLFIFLMLLIVTTSTLFLLAQTLKGEVLRISFLDVGQGDAVLLRTPTGYDILVDAGRDDRVLERLNEQMGYFDRHIDVLIITHPDLDHVTGVIPVLKKYSVSHIIVSPATSSTGIFKEVTESIEQENANVVVAKKGDVIDFGDGVTMTILFPERMHRVLQKDTNRNSVSVAIRYGEQSILLTGDLPQEDEKFLLTPLLPKEVTIYKAGHHGSKTSSGEQLLSYIRPHYSVISAGKDNDYGHPHEETLVRLLKYGREILSTIDNGTISFFLDGRSVRIKTAY